MSDSITVTILFTDVVGSVELRTRRGDESAHQIMRTHFDLVRPYIEQHSGQEVKTIGDSFMVAFGSPRSAVDCAVAVQRALAEYNRENSDDQVHVRMGMNTGEAIREEGDLFGSTVDAAARIMSKAAGGQILIPEKTREAIVASEDITLLDRGPFWLKGFPERWRLYEVLWHEERISTAAVLPRIGRQTPFVGRETERANLRQFLDAARGGHGSLVMIGGEPGVGKTRITEELTAEADRHGFLTLIGHCYEMEGAPPYIPFIEILQSIIRLIEPDTLMETLGDAAPEVAKLVPELREQFPNMPEPRKLPPEQERFYLFSNLRDFFERLGSQRPLLMVIEDLHWADEPTLMLLQHIAQRLNELAMLIIGTYRDTELDVARSLAKALEELLRQRLAHDLLLKRLVKSDVLTMLRGRSGQEPPSRLVELIFHETEGNPFFVEEVFKHLAEEEKLFDSEGHWRTDVRIEEWEVPRGVLLVIGRRLERVSEQCRRILARAAVIGRGVGFKLLNEVIELDEDALFDAIEEAERAYLIRSKKPNGEIQLTFAHEFIRQTLLSDLSLARRQRLHLRVAEAMERLYAGALEVHASELAYHCYEASGDPEKVIEYSVLAGKRATAQTAYEEAAEQYERALQVFEQQRPIDEFMRCDLLVALGDAYANAGDRSRTEETFLQVSDIARDLPAPEHFARAVLGYCRYSSLTGAIDSRRVGLLEEALALLPVEDSAFRASLMGRLSVNLEYAGLDERRFALSEQAVEMARRVGDPKALFYALWSRTFMWDRPLEKKITDAAELSDVGKEAGYPERCDWGLIYICSFHMEQGNIGASDADLALLKSRAKEAGNIFDMWASTHADATRACMTGRFDEAERLAFEAFSIGKIMIAAAPQQLGALIYALRWLQGRLDEIEEAMESEIEQYVGDMGITSLYAHMKATLGKKQEAQTVLENLSVHDFTDLPRYQSTLLVLTSLSEIAIAVSDEAKATRLYELLIPYNDRLFMIGINAACFGAMTLWLGMLAATLKRWNDAVEHFEHAIETNARIGARPFLARSQHEYARMLMERDDLGDKDKAKELLTEATTTYRELGMPTFLEDAEELKKNL